MIPTIPFISTAFEDTDMSRPRRRALGDERAQPGALSRPSPPPEDHDTFIEISAHPILTQAISETLRPGRTITSLGSLWRDGDDTVTFHTNRQRRAHHPSAATPHPPEPRTGSPPLPGTTAATGMSPQRRASNTLNVRHSAADRRRRTASMTGRVSCLGRHAIVRGQGESTAVAGSRPRARYGSAMRWAALRPQLGAVVAGRRCRTDRIPLTGRYPCLYAPGVPLTVRCRTGHPLFNAGRKLAAVMTDGASSATLSW